MNYLRFAVFVEVEYKNISVLHAADTKRNASKSLSTFYAYTNEVGLEQQYD